MVYSTARGFTGQEHLDHLALIHFNGRVFDPVLGRFISADPHIQYADNTQSYNRYSYVLNNALSATDPSGFFLKKLFKKIKKAIKKVVNVAADFGKGYFFLSQFSFLYAAPIRKEFRKSTTLQALGRFTATYFGGSVGAAGFEGYLTDISGGSFVEALVASGQAYFLNGGGEYNDVNGDFNASLRNGLRNRRHGGSVNGASSPAMANAVGRRSDARRQNNSDPILNGLRAIAAQGRIAAGGLQIAAGSTLCGVSACILGGTLMAQGAGNVGGGTSDYLSIFGIDSNLNPVARLYDLALPGYGEQAFIAVDVVSGVGALRRSFQLITVGVDYGLTVTGTRVVPRFFIDGTPIPAIVNDAARTGLSAKDVANQ